MTTHGVVWVNFGHPRALKKALERARGPMDGSYSWNTDINMGTRMDSMYVSMVFQVYVYVYIYNFDV